SGGYKEAGLRRHTHTLTSFHSHTSASLTSVPTAIHPDPIELSSAHDSLSLSLLPTVCLLLPLYPVYTDCVHNKKCTRVIPCFVCNPKDCTQFYLCILARLSGAGPPTEGRRPSLLAERRSGAFGRM